MCTVTAIFLIQPFFGFINLPVAIPVAMPIPIPDHYPLLPPPLLTKLIVPDHSLYLAGREWSGTEIVILSERLQYLFTRMRG